MLEQILTALLPEQLVSLAARRAGIAAILLFPAALVAGFFLLLKSSPPAPVTVTTSNLQAIEIARAFLLREGIPVTSWRATSKYDTSDNLLTFANDKPEHIRIWSVAPPVYATVTFRAPDSKDSVRVSVSVDGRVLGSAGKAASLPPRRPNCPTKPPCASPRHTCPPELFSVRQSLKIRRQSGSTRSGPHRSRTPNCARKLPSRAAGSPRRK